MKAILHRFILIGLLLIVIVGKAYSVTTYDWVGTTATAGVYNWNNKLNWQVAGVAATTIPGATDIVQIAVNSFTNNPTITDAESCASIVFGTYDNFTLTVNGALTVSGNITQKNDPNFYQYTILADTLDDGPAPAAWTAEIAALVKSLAPKHLFMDGSCE